MSAVKKWGWDRKIGALNRHAEALKTPVRKVVVWSSKHRFSGLNVELAKKLGANSYTDPVALNSFSDWPVGVSSRVRQRSVLNTYCLVSSSM